MKANFSTLVRRASLLAGAALALTAVQTRGTEKTATADAFPNFESYIKISGKAASVTGDENAFQNRTQLPRNGGGGIEDLHYVKEVSKDTTMEINGHALAGAEDYLAQFNIAKNEFGSVDFGYKSFRTFYDGVGGFFPTNRQWMPLTQRQLNLDRGKLWVDATLALPNIPVFTLRYSRETRDGQKDSTIWGDTDFTSMPNNVPPISQVRKLVPSYIDVNERTERIELSVKHTLEKTSFQLTLLGEDTKNHDTRYVTRFPGEAKPFPTPASTVLLPAVNMNNQIIQQQADGLESRTSGAMLTTETPLTDKLTLRAGASVQLVTSDFTGDRPLITSTPTSTGVVPITTYTFQGLTGGSHIRITTGNISLTYAATPALSVKFALKGEGEKIRGNSAYNVVAASGTPATTLTTTPRVDWANITQNTKTPELDVRYTGFKDFALYANGSLRQVRGVENTTSSYNPLTATNGTLAMNNVFVDYGNYTLGADWRSSGFLTLRTELFSKNHQTESVGFGTGSILGDYYMLDNKFTGVKATVVLKPSPEFTSTTRFIYQHGKMRVTGFLPTFPAYDSCDDKNQNISETIDWTPNSQFYAQASLNVVLNTIGTVYPRAGTAPATSTNIAWDVNQVLQNSENDYVTATILLGTVASKADDVQFQVNYYRADNGNAFLATRTLPYGVVAKDVSVTVGVKHKFSDRMIGNLKVGYLDSVNDTTGGNTNFRGPLGYISLEYAL